MTVDINEMIELYDKVKDNIYNLRFNLLSYLSTLQTKSSILLSKLKNPENRNSFFNFFVKNFMNITCMNLANRKQILGNINTFNNNKNLLDVTLKYDDTTIIETIYTFLEQVTDYIALIDRTYNIINDADMLTYTTDTVKFKQYIDTDISIKFETTTCDVDHRYLSYTIYKYNNIHEVEYNCKFIINNTLKMYKEEVILSIKTLLEHVDDTINSLCEDYTMLMGSDIECIQ